jgi:hypothetical protein
MKFLNFLRSLFFGKKKQAPIVPDAPVYREDLIVDESELEPIVEPEKAPIVEIPEVVAEQIAGEAVVVAPKKKKPSKKKKYNGNIT